MGLWCFGLCFVYIVSLIPGFRVTYPWLWLLSTEDEELHTWCICRVMGNLPITHNFAHNFNLLLPPAEQFEVFLPWVVCFVFAVGYTIFWFMPFNVTLKHRTNNWDSVRSAVRSFTWSFILNSSDPLDAFDLAIGEVIGRHVLTSKHFSA